ncbi:MAG: transketolase family protein, partial [Chloroflexi bacterium]
MWPWGLPWVDLCPLPTLSPPCSAWAMEQIRTCVCYARTNVKLAASYAGLSDYKDGPTHHAILDIALMRALPEMTGIVPADAKEIAAWVSVIAETDGPVYLRLSRSATLPVHYGPVTPRIGRGEVLRTGNDVTIITCGAMAGSSLQAAGRLASKGIDARVLHLPTVKPLDRDLILQAAEETAGLVCAEEHSILGGLGSAVA